MKNIIKSYLMPHPPIIIPDIGKGEEYKIKNTITSCNTIGKEISELKPETIIVITPHGTMFSDAISISNEEEIHGDFRNFRAINVKMVLKIDTQFNERLILNCHEDDVPAGLVDSDTLNRYGHEFTLDHGAMVPLYFINKYYTNYKLVHITYSMIGDINLYKFGMEIKKTAEELNRKCVIIASGDLSHKLKIINNSISAAIHDPRFPAVEEEELYDIDISVDVLTTPVKATKEELNPKYYGVIVSKGYKKGLLLPDLEGIDTVEEQLQIACDKGEIDYFSNDYNIEKFKVIRYYEVSD